MAGFLNRIEHFFHQPFGAALALFALLFLLVLWALSNIRPGPGTLWQPTDRAWLNAALRIAVILSPILLVLFVVVLILLTRVVWEVFAGTYVAKNPGELRWYILSFVGLLTALGGIIGTPLALIRIWNTERQTNAQEVGLSFDRFYRAIELLDSERKSIRISAMYNLAALAREAQTHSDSIVGVLTSHIRVMCSTRELQEFDDPIPEVKEGFPNRGNTDATQLELIERRTMIIDWVNGLRKKDEELQVALTLLGSIQHSTSLRLDFSDCNFQGVKFVNVDFANAIFSGSRFDGCTFENCSFDRASFTGTRKSESHSSDSKSLLFVKNPCTFLGCVFIRVEASKALLDGAIFDTSSFHQCKIFQSDFSGCSFLGASLAGLQASQSLFYCACLKTIWDSNPELAQDNFYPNALTPDDQDYSVKKLNGQYWNHQTAREVWIQQIEK